MTTLTVDTRTYRLRLPVLRVGRFRGPVVVEITEHIELRIEWPSRRRSSGHCAADLVAARVEEDRTRALAHRMGATF